MKNHIIYTPLELYYLTYWVVYTSVCEKMLLMGVPHMVNCKACEQ